MKDLFNEPEVLDLEPVRDNILLRFTTWGGGGGVEISLAV